jgi:carbamoyl-phosphate synthase small subunit
VKYPTITSVERKTIGRPAGGDFFVKPGALLLEDGTRFDGFVPEWQDDGIVGEVVFNTGMTGYVETLTDPSYSGQILTFTYPLIGNYGVPDPETWESDRMHLRGVVVSELTTDWSHETGERSLLEWLREQKVPVIAGIDTRALTKKLREHGVMAGTIRSDRSAAKLPAYIAPAIVSISEPRVYNPSGHKTIIAVDCGMKENILRHLVLRGYRVKRVPHDYDYTAEVYDGVLLSNGPGDPTDYAAAIRVLERAMLRDKPIFGICLGSQLMGLAAGAKTYKLLYGHRGHNQPAIRPDGQGFITSQNHGYAIDEATLPEGWEVSFRNLNDNSIEGIRHRTKPFSAVQFHPEAAPGPTDTNWLFEEFGKLV